MGRPKKAPDERRDERLPNLRVTAAERAYVEGQAALAGLSVVEFCRQAVLSKKITPRRATADDQLLLELNRAGVNLNQIARALNSDRPEHGDLADTLTAIQAALAKVLADGS